MLRGADLTLRPAEVVGLVGENGSGKSTLMKILVGALAVDEGTVTREGRLGYCPQEPQVADDTEAPFWALACLVLGVWLTPPRE